MTPHEKITAAVVLILLLAWGIGFAYHWWVNDWRYWFGGMFAGLSRTLPPLDLPGPYSDDHGWDSQIEPAVIGKAVRPDAGEGGWLRAGELHDEWEQLDPDQAADQLIAEWHGRPATWDGPPGQPCECPNLAGDCDGLHGDVWDQWWAGVDGLERECMLVHDWLVREERLWAELKAETRELCAA